MAKVTLADRLKIRMPAQPQQAASPQSSVPASGSSSPAPLKASKPKAASAAKVPGVNSKLDGDNSAETFNNTPQAPKTGRPMKDPKQPLMKALSDAQKHKIMTEVNQNLGQRNINSNDPALQQTGHEQQAKYGKPGDTAFTMVKKPGESPPAATPSFDPNKTKNIKGVKTAPLTISSNNTAAAPAVLDPNKTGTVGAPAKSVAKPVKKPSVVTPEQKAKIGRINTELGYEHVKSPDEHRQALGRHLLRQASTKDKIGYHGRKLLGVLRTKILKNEQELIDLKKNDTEGTVKDPIKSNTESKKKKKNPYEPKVKVTQAYSAPGKFSAGKFIMGVLGHGSPVANRVLNAAKQAVTKSNIETEFESLSKSQENQHLKLLKQIHEGSIDASSLVALLKKD